MKIVNNIQGTRLPSLTGGARGWVSLLPFLGKGLGVGFVCLLMASCANYDELDVQPQLELGDPVFAQFTISIPKSAGSGTRATDVVVQSAENFRGMDNIKLFAFAETDITASSQTPGSIGLIQMLKPTQQTVNNNIPQTSIDNSKAVLFGDVLIPSGTNSFLFYAKAYDNVSTVADKFNNGTLTPSGLDGTNTTPAAFSFSPEAITTATNSNDKRTAIITYLNSIKNATDGTTAWPATTNVILGNLYNQFTGMTAGSSKNLQAEVQRLYNLVKDDTNTLAQAIKTAISNSTYVSSTDIANDIVTFNDNIAGYPSTSDNLPDGAARLTFESGSFAYAEASSSATTLNVGALTNYAYPPCLYYRVESGVKVSNTSEAEHYTPTATWGDNGTNDILKNYSDGSVTNNTRSVAMVAPVQYAVGRLDVRLASNKNTTLKDYNDQDIDFTNGKIKMTGILIGGQKPVDWEFKPQADDLSATPAVIIPEYTVYEDFTRDGGIDAKDIAYATSFPTTNKLTVASADDATLMTRTLVLETAGAADEVVNIALEFQNNTGSDFVGRNGQIVPNGCKFYLVGALNMAAGTTSGQSNTGNKVFKQDYITLADFTISDLKLAENTIPNLQKPQLELGLSVNWTWQTGFSQTIEINNNTNNNP